jgi:hypothetical protein
MQPWKLLFLFLAQLFLPLVSPTAGSVELSNVQVSYQYGQQITFQADLKSTQTIKEAYLVLLPQGQAVQLQPILLTSPDQLSVIYDLQQNPLAPFSTLQYWFRFIFPDNSEYNSPAQSLKYVDNRFTWQSASNGVFEANWVQGDQTFGQAVLNVAAEGLQSALAILPVAPPQPLQIYVYSSAADLQSALQMTTQPWVAGHASPEIGVILISIKPGPEALLELQRQLPHEILHILQYRQLGEKYWKIPTWLIEGMASAAEQQPDPDYQRAIERAVQQNNLIPLSTLCGPFPVEASSAYLAYAQSNSLVRYLIKTYGASSLGNLLAQYQDGRGCEEGVQAVYKLSLTQLDNQWREQALGYNPTQSFFKSLSPYLLIAGVLFLPALIAGVVVNRKNK